MYKMFGIIVNFTNTKTLNLIKTFNNKLEALGFIEEMVEEYITKKDGEERAKEPMITEPSSYKSRRWASLPFGHFKTRNTDESLHKQTVWCKTKTSGYLYNSYRIDKVFSLDMVHMSENKMTQMEALETLFDEYQSDSEYDSYVSWKQHREVMDEVLIDILKLSEPQEPQE